MNHRELELFLHLCKTLSFAKTSAACHVAPSSLSRVIQRLEKEVGRDLFERDSRRVKLTPTGQAFRSYAAQTCDNWELLRQTLQDQDAHLQGELSVFCSVTASYTFLDDILGRFRMQHPGIEIKLHTGDSAATLERIRHEEEDIGIAALPEKVPAQFAVLELTSSPLVVIVPARSTLPGLDVPVSGNVKWGEIPLIVSESGLVRDSLDEWLRSIRVKPHVQAQVAGHEAIVSMVGLGFGAGVVPGIVLENSPFAGKVRQLAVKHAMPPIRIGLCVLKRKLNHPLIRAFWTLAGQSIAGNM